MAGSESELDDGCRLDLLFILRTGSEFFANSYTLRAPSSSAVIFMRHRTASFATTWWTSVVKLNKATMMLSWDSIAAFPSDEPVRPIQMD